MKTVEALEPAGRRVLGVDAGDRRIGVAVSNELGTIAQPVLTLTCSNRRRDLKSLGRIAKKWNCGEIVLGYPLSLSGSPNRQSTKIERLADALRREVQIPVHLWDERFSTAEAHRYLDETGRHPSSRRIVIDQLAAVLILQTFLDARRHAGGADTA